MNNYRQATQNEEWQEINLPSKAFESPFPPSMFIGPVAPGNFGCNQPVSVSELSSPADGKLGNNETQLQ